MKTIYLDEEFRCHVTNDGTMNVVETEVFDGYCNEYIEGYRFVPFGSTWVRKDGIAFKGEMISPWKPHSELDAAQREYEKQVIQQLQQTVSEKDTTIAELDAALLDATYANLVGE